MRKDLAYGRIWPDLEEYLQKTGALIRQDWDITARNRHRARL
jgi:hypothetical protein